jgi:hypothetical protein
MSTDLFPAPCSTPRLFAEFYARYPRKVGIGAARKAYVKALKTTQHDDIMFGLSQQLASMEAKDKQFIPHASTWLNQERWADEPEEPTGKDSGGTNGPGTASGSNGARERSIRAAESFGKRSACSF